MYARNLDDLSDDEYPSRKSGSFYKNWGNLTAFDEFKQSAESPDSRRTNNLSVNNLDNFILRKSDDRVDHSRNGHSVHTLSENNADQNPLRNGRMPSRMLPVRNFLEVPRPNTDYGMQDTNDLDVDDKYGMPEKKKGVKFKKTGLTPLSTFPRDKRVDSPVVVSGTPPLAEVFDTVENWRKASAQVSKEWSDDEGLVYSDIDIGDEQGMDNQGFQQESKEDNLKQQSTSKKRKKTPDLSLYDLLDWDVFREYMYDTDLYACEGLYVVVQKILKVLFILISFVLILATLVMSKLTLLFVTSNMNLDVGFRKNYGQCDDTDPYTGECSVGIIGPRTRPLAADQCGVPVEYDEPDMKQRDMIRWMWCMWMCMCLPYLITFVHSMWKIIFRNKKAPTCRSVAFVMFIEALHVGGLMLLFFICLPGLDVFRGMFLLNATALYPAFFKLFIRPKVEKFKGFQIFGDVLAFIFQLGIIVLYIGITVWGEQEWSNNPSNSSYTCMADPINQGQEVFGLDINGQEMNITNMTTTTAPYISTEPLIDVNYTRCGPGKETIKDPRMFLIPIALFLASFGWWQNYLGKDLNMLCSRGLGKINKEIKRGKTKLFAIVSIWKIAFSFALFLALGRFYHLGDPEKQISVLFGLNDGNDSSPFHDHNYVNNERETFETDWLIVFGINAVSGLLCYIVSLHAIQARTQLTTYSAAISLATPVTLLFALFGFCINCSPEGKNIASTFNIDELYWNCYDGFNNMSTLIQRRPLVLVGIAIWISQLILGRHLWTPKCQKLAKAGRIFVQPYYCGLLLEQSMVYNRLRNDKHKQKTGKLPRFVDDITPKSPTIIEENPFQLNRSVGASVLFRDDPEADDMEEVTRSLAFMDEPLFDRPDRSQPMIYICATMWHENEQEMIQMIKSIIRLDMDQCIRRLTRDFFQVEIVDYYDFEAHIFFDDAFEKYVPGDPMFKVNRFVELFVKVINGAASYVHKCNVILDPPTKVPTPYGGKLIYNLPGNNKLTLHLKDKQKIRHRKRWSQVMYLYYLFGYRLWNNRISRKIKEQVAYNTYILTLDGDVDFKPEAVLLLVDLMKRDYSVGAACGRIHPEGHGPMVWYQKFEYAISHWLQKSTEHVLGCVLCSPGCFSLFRASALMDDNIMKTYAKTAEGAMQHVQYDQGEDRWLCTLLLQRGYRVEYSAAADALTFAPEGFNEFFNQRRRWTPSTFANILDLLSTGRQTAARNENISILYIIYQGGLLASSILGPATILLMTVGAFSSVFTTLTPTGTFFLVFAPISAYVVLCLIGPSNLQLGFGAILGGLFAIAQMVVLVGIIGGIVRDGLCSPTTWFLLATTGIFVISAVLHPQEFTNILHGVLYFLAIPTMYLLLIIYSLCNLNVISWGTREVVQTKAEQDRLKKRQEEITQQVVRKNPGRMSKLMSLFGAGNKAGGKEDGWTLSCGTCCRCMCCPRPGESPTDKAIGALERKMDIVLGKLSTTSTQDDYDSNDDDSTPLLNDHSESKPESESSESSEEEPQPDYLDDNRPYWTTLPDSVGKGRVDDISDEESHFWTHLIKRYLEPIDKNPEREERIKKELKGLRNKTVIGFFMLDLLFIVLIQTLQTIPEGGGTPGSSDTNAYFLTFNCTDPVSKVTTVQSIEPIGFAFLLVFGLFLIIQFIGMLFHRLFSLLQIVSTTAVAGKREKDKNEHYVKLAKLLAKPDNIQQTEIETTATANTSIIDDNDKASNYHLMDDNAVNAGGVISNIISRLQNKVPQVGTIEQSFARNFMALQNQIDTLPPEEIEELQRTDVRGRTPSFIIKGTNQTDKPAMQRKRSVHADAVKDIVRRRSSIFSPKRSKFIRNRYKMTDSELDIAQMKLKHLLPEVAEPIIDYYPGYDTDEEF